MAGKQLILVACPQERDRREVAAAGLDRRFDVLFAGPDLDAEAGDARALVAELTALPADAVVGTKDRSALVAALVAARRGLPGPRPETLTAIQHKPSAREVQRRSVPAATPRFARLAGLPPFPPPWFVKPAVGRLSQGARRVDVPAQLPPPDDLDPYAAAWAELAGVDACGYLVEELLAGEEVTVEGYVHRGRVTVLGVTDSLKYPGTGSFEAFAYPSLLPPGRRAELAETAARAVRAFGFDDGLFNVELAVPQAGPAKIIEVNGRLASQFAPLVRALHGRSTYEALFRVALGEDPGWRPSEPDGAAVSYVLRAFEDAFVAAVPEPEEGLEVLVRPGQRLSEQRAANDVASYRLAILVEAGATREEALARCRERARRLPFLLRPAPSRPDRAPR